MKFQPQRLLKVAQALREAEPMADLPFQMSTFGHSCGTPACALGHYAARKDLNGERFSLRGRALVHKGRDVMWGWDEAATVEFGISHYEAWELFSATGCDRATTREEAAQYIEDFISRKKAGFDPYSGYPDAG